jgi:hypothetical protein
MSVYVDDMRPCIRNRNWRWDSACHLFADSVSELHKFARKLSLKRTWFQNNTVPHYDLAANKRQQAVRFGATEVDDRAVVEIIRKHRNG